MDSFTHFLMGLFVGSLFPNLQMPTLLFYAAFMASLPDLDVILGPLKRKYNSYYLSHRGASHSIVIAIPVAAIFAAIFYPFQNVSYFSLWIYGILFYGLHLALDLFTTSKIPFLYPITKKEFRGSADRAVNVYLMLGSFLLFIIGGVFLLVFPTFDTLEILRIVGFIWYGLYFSIRGIYRVIFALSLSKGKNYIPGLKPFSYSIYSQGITDFNHTFKLVSYANIFKNSLPSFSISILKNSENYIVFEKALDCSKQYRFFSKWEGVLPFIWEDKNEIKCLLVLSESLSNFHGYCCLGVFNSTTKELISHNDKFDYLSEVPATLIQSSILDTSISSEIE